MTTTDGDVLAGMTRAEQEQFLLRRGWKRVTAVYWRHPARDCPHGTDVCGHLVPLERAIERVAREGGGSR